MSTLKNIGSDLVEKRLWPLAIALVLALVAIPLLLNRGGTKDVPPAPVAPATTSQVSGADGSVAEVTLRQEPGTAKPRNRPGAVRNPFARQIKQKQASAAASTPTSTPASTPASSSTPSTPSVPSSTGGSGVQPTPSTGTTPAPAPKPKAKPQDLDSYSLDLLFGNTDSKARTLDNVARLTPLPSADNPFFVYLGLLDDAKTAVFLVSTDAVATGDGTCRPSKTTCETIELKAGDTEYFDVTTPGGRQVQYVMHVRRINRASSDTSTAAAAARARVSKAGQTMLVAAAKVGAGPKARAHRGMLQYRYVPSKGVLQRARTATVASAAGDKKLVRRSARNQPGVAPFRTRVPVK